MMKVLDERRGMNARRSILGFWSGFAGAAWLHAFAFAGLFLEVGWPWRVAKALLLIACGELEQFGKRKGMIVDARANIAAFCIARWHRGYRQVFGLDVCYLVP